MKPKEKTNSKEKTMTITPNDLASNTNNSESSAPKAGDQEAKESKFAKATKKVKAKR